MTSFLSKLLQDNLSPRESISHYYADRLRADSETLKNKTDDEVLKTLDKTNFDHAFAAIIDYLEEEHKKKLNRKWYEKLMWWRE